MSFVMCYLNMLCTSISIRLVNLIAPYHLIYTRLIAVNFKEMKSKAPLLVTRLLLYTIFLLIANIFKKSNKRLWFHLLKSARMSLALIVIRQPHIFRCSVVAYVTHKHHFISENPLLERLSMISIIECIKLAPLMQFFFNFPDRQ